VCAARAFFLWLCNLFFGNFGRKIANLQGIFWRNQMAKKQPIIKLDYKLSVVDVHKIKPSPYQVRKFFDEDKKKGLAGSIQQDGLIQPVVVRRNNGHPEIIAGERRVQAIRDYTGIKSVPARVVEASDIQSRRIAAAENFQREDLAAIETVEAIVELVDAELIEDIKYQRSKIGDRRSELQRTLKQHLNQNFEGLQPLTRGRPVTW
jgi:ParB/RepB/Spo0J family partition protein